jgi:hypothetical protein
VCFWDVKQQSGGPTCTNFEIFLIGVARVVQKYARASPTTKPTLSYD